jgi:hypothetical protein
VQLGPPEAGGRVDFASEHDEKTMTMLGLSSKREVTRASIRVRTAMAAQTRDQGRYLGGRPPYGYRLADAGPHPNKAHAAWGRRARRLDPDPQTAPVVRWMFAQRLAGHSVARIARALSEAGVPCPLAADPARNPHRDAAGWTLGTVTTILQDPRYTGRQVWNRQRTDAELADPGNVTSAMAPDPGRAKNTYIREDKLLTHLPVLHLLLTTPLRGSGTEPAPVPMSGLPRPPRTSPDDLAAELNPHKTELNPHKAVEAASRARTDQTGLPSSGQSPPTRQLAKAELLSRRLRSAVPITLRYRDGPSLRTRSRRYGRLRGWPS